MDEQEQCDCGGYEDYDRWEFETSVLTNKKILEECEDARVN